MITHSSLPGTPSVLPIVIIKNRSLQSQKLGDKLHAHLTSSDTIFNLVTLYFLNSFNDQGKKNIQDSKTSIIWPQFFYLLDSIQYMFSFLNLWPSLMILMANSLTWFHAVFPWLLSYFHWTTVNTPLSLTHRFVTARMLFSSKVSSNTQHLIALQVLTGDNTE